MADQGMVLHHQKEMQMPKIQPSPPCVICGVTSVAKQLCNKHYMRFQRHGTTENTRPKDWGAREKHPLYQSWQWASRRSEYGCVDAWKDFWVFADDVGPRPDASSRLVRVDAEQPFGPENCYWTQSSGPLPKDHDKAARAAWQRKYRKNHPAQHKAYEVKRKRGFSLTIQEYDMLLEKQNGVCAICGNACAHFSLAVDHCHQTGEIRGLLCSQCNRGLGLFRDEPERLRKAAEYLERSSRWARNPPIMRSASVSGQGSR